LKSEIIVRSNVNIFEHINGLGSVSGFYSSGFVSSIVLCSSVQSLLHISIVGALTKRPFSSDISGLFPKFCGFSKVLSSSLSLNNYLINAFLLKRLNKYTFS